MYAPPIPESERTKKPEPKKTKPKPTKITQILQRPPTKKQTPEKSTGKYIIIIIKAASFRQLTKNKNAQIFAISIKNILSEQNRKKSPELNLYDILPKKYHHLINIFLKKSS